MVTEEGRRTTHETVEHFGSVDAKIHGTAASERTLYECAGECLLDILD